MTDSSNETLVTFVDHVVAQLAKNGYPERRVAFPIERMYESAYAKGLSFNKVLDVLAERNAFGRQLHSFEADFAVEGVPGGPVHAIFIRAPWIAEYGPDVDVLADVDGHPGRSDLTGRFTIENIVRGNAVEGKAIARIALTISPNGLIPKPGVRTGGV